MKNGSSHYEVYHTATLKNLKQLVNYLKAITIKKFFEIIGERLKKDGLRDACCECEGADRKTTE